MKGMVDKNHSFVYIKHMNNSSYVQKKGAKEKWQYMMWNAVMRSASMRIV